MASQPSQTPSPAAGADADAARDVRRERLLRLAPLAVLTLWAIVVTALLARWSIDSRYVFRDETNAVNLGRLITQDLGQLIDGDLARGPERMTALLAALAAWLTDDPGRQFELLHGMTSLCQGLVVFPVWMTARQLGLGRWVALAPAAIASAGCFAFYGVFTLNTSVGLLAASFLLWALVRALRRPGLLSDALIVVTLALTVLSRLGWAPLVAAIVPALLATTWFARPAGERFGAWLKALPRRLWKRHPLLLAGAGALVVAALVVGPSMLLGGRLYGGVRLEPDIQLDALWGNVEVLFAHLAIGVGIVPLVLALPLLLRSLVRPADPVEGGFAWLVLGYVVIFSWAYYYSMNEDRYFAVLAPPLVLAGALAIAGRKPPPLWATAVSGVAVAWLVATNYEWPVRDAFDYFIAPTSRFFGDVIVGRLSGYVPFDRGALPALAAVGAALVAIALVALMGRRTVVPRWLRIGAPLAVLAGLLAYQLGSMDHPARKFVQRVGMTDVPEERLEFIDRVAEGGRSEPLAVDGGVDPDLQAQMQMLQVFNASLGYGTTVGRIDERQTADRFPSPMQVTVDWRTGAVAGGEHPPDVLVSFNGRATVGFEGEQLPGEELFPWAILSRPDAPLRTSWIIRNDLPDHFADPARPMQLRVFPERAGECVTGNVLQHPVTDRRFRYRIAADAPVRGRGLRGFATPGTPLPFRIRLATARPVTFTLRSAGGRVDTGEWRAPAFVNVDVGPCRAS